MATSLSTYWVKFFTNAGFPHDVATKHAVVFSNNRIKPDMLPELDKPSLKEMGITLMGDMIAILRYAKKVSEEMTCERFLVDTINDLSLPKLQKTIKAPVKKVPSKISNVSLSKNTVKTPLYMTNSNNNSNNKETTTRPPKTVASLVTATLMQKKKSNVVAPSKRIISGQTQPTKRKIEVEKTHEILRSSSESDEEWSSNIQKRSKISAGDDKKNHQLVVVENKKNCDQKRTVFDRLGDSSVTSTTNLTDLSTKFNVTGLGEVFKRNSSVFNRLGDKDAAKKDSIAPTTLVKNEVNNEQPHGILKSRVSNIGGSTVVKIKTRANISNFTNGTMHADYEKKKKHLLVKSVKQLDRTTKVIESNSNLVSEKIVRKITGNSKLAASEKNRTIPPAKSRLGLNSGSHKQVTFNRITTIAHIKKPGVFSRLGI